ncbi:hypothetical protein FHX37_3512 [Haloactinospora alba]|uniref:PH (Pleckstrin Homology) domain-containing protein n=1 Tax=Haloactinospora alba TaxID=405555 RepID=A0A543NNT3_9ACTN|nr:hypothetical protein [Haloactinospora alba]TQN33491.1 hypothetical protein FHX37_3512 [Haloactinospora alba]
MSEPVRLVCPMSRKYGELAAGAAGCLAGLGAVVAAPTSWAVVGAGIACVLAGAALLWHGARIAVPVLEVSDGEFRYRRGRYIVRVPCSRLGSYYVLAGRARSLGLCDPVGQPYTFPSVEGRRATRPYLPLTGVRSSAKVEAFMASAGVPPRDRSLTSGTSAR